MYRALHWVSVPFVQTRIFGSCRFQWPRNWYRSTHRRSTKECFVPVQNKWTKNHQRNHSAPYFRYNFDPQKVLLTGLNNTWPDDIRTIIFPRLTVTSSRWIVSSKVIVAGTTNAVLVFKCTLSMVAWGWWSVSVFFRQGTHSPPVNVSSWGKTTLSPNMHFSWHLPSDRNMPLLHSTQWSPASHRPQPGSHPTSTIEVRCISTPFFQLPSSIPWSTTTIIFFGLSSTLPVAKRVVRFFSGMSNAGMCKGMCWTASKVTSKGLEASFLDGFEAEIWS